MARFLKNEEVVVSNPRVDKVFSCEISAKLYLQDQFVADFGHFISTICMVAYIYHRKCKMSNFRCTIHRMT